MRKGFAGGVEALQNVIAGHPQPSFMIVVESRYLSAAEAIGIIALVNKHGELATVEPVRSS